MTDEAPKPQLSTILQELRIEYLEKLPGKIAHLKELTNHRKWDELEEEYHKLKGTGKTYGFPEISTISEMLETMAQQKNTQIPEVFEKSLQLFEKMHQNYLQNRAFDLNSDAFARELLARNGK